MDKVFQKYIFIFFFFLFGSGLIAQDFREVKFAQVDSLLSHPGDRVMVINFWATWCKPCVEELPYFVKAAKHFENDPVDFLFISLDFQGQIDSKLKPFLTKTPLPGTSWWLNERKFSKMIDRVEKDWSGAIPFTLVLQGSAENRKHFEGELDYESLVHLIEEKL